MMALMYMVPTPETQSRPARRVDKDMRDVRRRA